MPVWGRWPQPCADGARDGGGAPPLAVGAFTVGFFPVGDVRGRGVPVANPAVVLLTTVPLGPVPSVNPVAQVAAAVQATVAAGVPIVAPAGGLGGFGLESV